MPRRIFSLITFGLLFVSTSIFAGSFTPTPSSPDSSFYTLSDIYTKISTSTFEYSTHNFSPAASPTGTFTTLSDIWDSINWQTLNNSGTLAAGFFATSSLTEAEPNLIASNIATGTTVFGVMGTCAPAKINKGGGSNLLSGLVAYYPLDGDVKDSSGNGNDGTNAGGAIATSSGKIGGAYSFTGASNSYLSTSVAAGNAIDGAGNSGHSFTFSVWAKFGDLTSSHNMFIGKGTQGSWWSDSYLMFGEGGNYGPVIICLGYINSNGRICLESNISYVDQNVWHNWAVVHDLENKTLTLYRDGQNIASSTYTNDLYYTHYNIPLTIGAHTGDCCWPSRFHGVIDEVAIWNRPLSLSEITELYNNGNGLNLP